MLPVGFLRIDLEGIRRGNNRKEDGRQERAGGKGTEC